MKQTLLTIMIIMFALSCAYSQSEDWQWSKRAGGIEADFGQVIGTDPAGNVYVAGRFRVTASFGSTSLTSYGGSDIFIAKLSPTGSWLWAKRAGVPDFDFVHGMAVDGSGNAYIIGKFGYSATFGTITLPGNGYHEIFIAKIDTNGNWLWAKKAGGTGWDEGWGICLDSNANVYVTGNFEVESEFGTTILTSSGNWDVFVAKLDTIGNWLWAERAGGPDADCGRGIALDTENNICLTGYFYQNAVFGSITLINSGNSNIYLAKMDSTANWLWAIRAGGPVEASSCAVAVNSDNEICLTGAYFGSVEFGNTTLTSNGESEFFVAKSDAVGNWLWAITTGGTLFDITTGIAIDDYNNIYVTGYVSETISLGSLTLIISGNFDFFIAKLNSDGFWLWAEKAWSTGYDEGSGITVDLNNNICVTGDFQLSGDFGPTPLTSVGEEDVFITKFSAAIVATEDETIPTLSAYLIYNAFPNPFYLETTISYTLPVKGQVCLAIYNSKGQLVKRLLDEPQTKGEHSLTWDGRDDNGNSVASGLYFCRIASAVKQESRKLLLVK